MRGGALPHPVSLRRMSAHGIAPAPPVIWAPGPEDVARAAITRFARFAEARAGVALPAYADLWRWSVDDLDAFWRAVWDFFDVDGDRGDGPALARAEMPGAVWFPGARLNWAEHVLRAGSGDEVAIVAAAEDAPDRDLTWGALRDAVARAAAGLRDLGVGRGDAVVAYLPNVPEAVVAVLACGAIGAVFSSCSPDFGTRSVVDRFAQLRPKVLIAADGYRYGGRAHDRLATVAELRAALPTLEHTVLVPVLDAAPVADGTTPWAGLVARPAAPAFERLPFDHPLWVLWSSGTTGLPKGLVQGHGGIVLEHLKAIGLHCDLGPGDRLLWFTTTGWMMWNFLIGGLLCGASIVLVDGSPGRPDLGRLWGIADRAGVTCFGTSAPYIAACRQAGVRPRASGPLARLRSVGSTGSPLSPEGFDWVRDELGAPWLFSLSGGSDVCTAFVGGCPTLPVRRGELQCRALGAAVEAWDEHGRPVIGQVGELVLTAPLPSMPLRLIGDDTGERYRDAYFSMWPGVWRHGDWITITADGGAVIHGRSDATINRGGVRMGTAEIYAAVLADPAYRDALVVDVPALEGEGSEILLFVVPAAGGALDDDARRRLRQTIRAQCSPRHVPDAIHAAPEVPKTLSGKTLEIPVKRILSGEPPERAASAGALADPRALDWFVAFGKTRRGGPRADTAGDASSPDG